MDDRLQVGLAYLWKQSAFRVLGTYRIVLETEKTPAIDVGFGLQGIATGNPGYFAIATKSFQMPEGHVTAFGGVGYRTNEEHFHGLGGVKFSPLDGRFTLGLQADGHYIHPFVTAPIGSNMSIGAYWIETRTWGILFSVVR